MSASCCGGDGCGLSPAVALNVGQVASSGGMNTSCESPLALSALAMSVGAEIAAVAGQPSSVSTSDAGVGMDVRRGSTRLR